jgi:hypothetical protein
MDPPRRPQSTYGYPPPSPTFSFGSASSSRPHSPPPSAPSPQGSPRRRPTQRGHKTTSSLSSLAQLNLHGSPSFHSSPSFSSPNSTPPLGPPSASPDRNGAGGYRLERSNSVLASPSTHWGGFTSFSSPGGQAGGGPGREYEDVQNRTFCKWCVISFLLYSKDRSKDASLQRKNETYIVLIFFLGSMLVSNHTAMILSSTSERTSATGRG